MPNNMQRIRSRSKPRSGGRINHHSHWMVAVAIVLVIIGSCVPFPPRWRPFLLEARAYTSSPPPTTLDGSSSRRHRSTSIVGARMHRRLQFHHSAVAIASSQRPSQPTTHFGVRANIIRLFGADDDAAVGGGGGNWRVPGGTLPATHVTKVRVPRSESVVQRGPPPPSAFSRPRTTRQKNTQHRRRARARGTGR